MSLSSLMFFVSCWACFRVGEFHARHPGLIASKSMDAWQWLCDWLKGSH
ncbi:MAG: hypothetical protein KF708_09030 [Pirellulales bacterium]|nr:hypothetical protein [Pirellulales bacterium]